MLYLLLTKRIDRLDFLERASSDNIFPFHIEAASAREDQFSLLKTKL